MPEREQMFGELKALFPASDPSLWTCECKCGQLDDVPIPSLENGEYNECVTCTAAKSTPLLGYYLGRTPDNEGRMLKDTWNWSDDALEVAHDFIQWWFPTKTVSNFNEAAPILTDLEMSYWKTGHQLKIEVVNSGKRWLTPYPRGSMKTVSILDDNFTKTYERFLRFLGMRNRDNAIDTLYKDALKDRPHIWLKFNHNHLRITRMLESMRLLGYEEWAKGFLEFTEEFNESYDYVNISVNTFNHWRHAVNP